jgi:hypothetical protein
MQASICRDSSAPQTALGMTDLTLLLENIDNNVEILPWAIANARVGAIPPGSGTGPALAGRLRLHYT